MLRLVLTLGALIFSTLVFAGKFDGTWVGADSDGHVREVHVRNDHVWSFTSGSWKQPVGESRVYGDTLKFGFGFQKSLRLTAKDKATGFFVGPHGTKRIVMTRK